VRLENSFEVPAAPERAWDLLMDVPRVVPCMPGTELTETVDDSTWKARMRVKIGPMSFAFATDVKREAADEAARRARLSARAREERGRGGGQATIESTLVPVDGGTRVQLVTELTLQGAVAQYGRGMVEDVSAQLVDRFAECLQAELTKPEDGAPAREAGAPRPPAEAVSGLSLILGALRRAVARIFRRREP
jgi:carbon monoxide dehydrogenase subunit G